MNKWLCTGHKRKFIFILPVQQNYQIVLDSMNASVITIIFLVAAATGGSVILYNREGASGT